MSRKLRTNALALGALFLGLCALGGPAARADEKVSALAPLGPVVRHADEGIAAFLKGATAAEAWKPWLVEEPDQKLRDENGKAGVASARCFALELELLFYAQGKGVYYLRTLVQTDVAGSSFLGFRGRQVLDDGEILVTGTPLDGLKDQLAPFGEAARAIVDACKGDRGGIRLADPEAVKKAVTFKPAQEDLLEDLAEAKEGLDATCAAIAALKADRIDVRIDDLSFLAYDAKGADMGVIRGDLESAGEGKVAIELGRWKPWKR